MTESVASRVRPPAASPARIALGIALAIVVAVVGNILVGELIGLISGRGSAPGRYALYSLVGVLAGVIGWVVVRQLAPRPAPVLRILVPVVVLLSFVPDVMLWLDRGSAATVLVVGLMVMHVVVAVPTVLVLRRVLPV